MSDGASSGVADFFIRLLAYWVAYSHMIPISLYVMIEVLKLIQAYLIKWDEELYCGEAEQYSECRNSDLTEELGQVEFIFSDKTGTLTQNKMEFKKCTVNMEIYGDAVVEDGPIDRIPDKNLAEVKSIIQDNNDAEENEELRRFFLFLAVCHNIVVD